MRTKPLKRVPKDGNSVGCCCESTGIIKSDQKDVLRMKRNLGKNNESASYCCKSANTFSAEKLPSEDAY